MSNTGSSAGLGQIPIWGSATQANDIAQSMMTLVSSFIQQLENVVANLVPPVINPSFPTVGTPPKLTTAAEPALETVSWSVPSSPGSFSGSINIAPYIPGTFNGQPPTLNFGSAPAQFSGSIPASPQLDFNFNYPTINVTLPDPPSLLSIDNVTFNPLNIPAFTGQQPQLTISTPPIIPYVEGSGYTSVLLTTVQDDLLDAITDGTNTGLSASAQQALWDAGREREYRQQADSLAALDRDVDTLGYQLPPGVYTDARFKLYSEMQYTTASLSRDIMYKQADLQLTNVNKARELSITLEGELIGYANNMAQRAFEAAKYVTEAQVQIYNAEVETFKAQLDGYRATIDVYNAQLKGIELYIEQLKAQIEFENTKATINTALVQQYKTEVDAVVSQIDIYKLQVQIIETQANIQKIQVEAYSAQIQAFVGTVNAYTAEVEGYKANIEAQSAIEGVYKTQVDAYAVEVQAGVGIVNALVNEYDAQIKAYTAQLDLYRAQLQAMVEQARAAQEYNTSAVEAFKGEVSAVTSYNQVLTSQWEAVLNEQEKIAEVAVKAAEANGQLYIAARQLSIDAAKTGAQTAAQLGAAALNAIHFSNTSSWGLSESLVSSTSVSTSTSTNTNYNESV